MPQNTTPTNIEYSIDDFSRIPNPIAKYYQDFDVGNRILLTGHSHQAWPDCAKDGLAQAWRDATLHVDDKWQKAFEQADKVKQFYRSLMDDTTGNMTLGPSTHDLLIRFLSALPLKTRPAIITTDGEFLSMQRQLDALSQAGLIKQIKVPVNPIDTLIERISNKVDDTTAAVMMSYVFFETGLLCPPLNDLAKRCEEKSTTLLIDVYHALNVLPLSIQQQNLESAFLVGGGYKYCQLGEGNCFLRTPKNTELMPVITGWFSEFGLLDKNTRASTISETIQYGDGDWRFAGSTYDPISHYRAGAVIDFFQQQKLTPSFLREINVHQIRCIADQFDELKLPHTVIQRDAEIPIEQKGGFLTLKTPHANLLAKALKKVDVYCDARNNHLRLGPAPYLNNQQLLSAVSQLKTAISTI